MQYCDGVTGSSEWGVLGVDYKQRDPRRRTYSLINGDVNEASLLVDFHSPDLSLLFFSLSTDPVAARFASGMHFTSVSIPVCRHATRYVEARHTSAAAND